MITHLIAGFLEKMLQKNDSVFSKTIWTFWRRHYATKKDLKNTTGIDTYKLAAKSNLASLNTEIDKLDIRKVIPAPVG